MSKIKQGNFQQGPYILKRDYPEGHLFLKPAAETGGCSVIVSSTFQTAGIVLRSVGWCIY